MPRASLQIRVPFHDVDSSGRIHFTAMFRYIEIAEHALTRLLGFPYATSFPDISFPRVHVACDFRGAIRYDDELIIEARVDHVGYSSWTVAFTAQIAREAGTDLQERLHAEEAIVAEGQMTMVAIDTKTERSRPLPDDLRKALTGN